MSARYKIIFSRVGNKSLEKLPKPVRTQILKKLTYLASLNTPMKSAKKLEGMKNRYRWRIGDYRAVFEKNNQGELVLLVIVNVAHRQNIYD